MGMPSPRRLWAADLDRLDQAGGVFTVARLVEILGCSECQAYNLLRYSRRYGLMRRVKRGTYALMPAKAAG